MKTIELDIVFLSYDEPNADLHLQIYVTKFLGPNEYTE